MKQTLAGMAMVAAVLAAIALTAGGKHTRGRYGYVSGGTVKPEPMLPAR
jgi:hypothetical protein